MCGRFTLTEDGQILMDQLRIPMVPEDYRVRYNIAPGQPIMAVFVASNGRRAAMFRWGLVPSWAKDDRIGYKMINARSETALEKPSFKRAFEKRRCVIPADSFYEWKREGNRKTPMRFLMKSRGVFLFAGLWEAWRPPGSESEERLFTCTILTTGPNALVETVHDRMPVILAPQDVDAWLDPEVPAEAAAQLCGPYPAEEMDVYEVSTIVNSTKNDSKACIEPVAG